MPQPTRPAPQPTTRPRPAPAGPPIEPWGDYPALPSLLLIGGSGTGKTHGIAQLCDAGFTVVVVAIEDKLATLSTRKPLRVNICAVDERTNSLPSPQLKWSRLQQFTDALRRGAYREHAGASVDIIAVDGLMEVSDIIAKVTLGAHSAGDTIKAWSSIAIRTVDFFKDLRDAAGEAASRLGGRPVGVLATCGEGDRRRVNMQAGTQTTERNVPLLEGNKALLALPFQFEVIWRLSAGIMFEGSAHEFRVHTAATEEFFAKSPGGLFPPVVVGPGGPGNDPDVGKMYRAMLTDSKSPYCASK